MKFPPLNKYCFCFLFLFVSSLNTTIVFSQTTVAPQVLPFVRICAGAANYFDATFNYSGFPVGTTFEVLLSDPSGSFTNPVSTTKLSFTDTGSQMTITFAVPTNLIGSDNYKLRVKSSTGFTSGNFFVKDPNGGTLSYFPAYYKNFEGAFFINNKQSTATICTGGSVILSIDNPTPNIANSSPANYPNLKYKWFRGNDILISGQTGTSITVNTPDTYYAQLDYGPCSDGNYRSNAVTVNQSAGGSSGFVSSSLGNPFCSGGASTTLSSITGNTYQWSKDGINITGATNATYNTNQAGKYSVRIDFGGCASTYSIDLKEITITSTINISNPSVIKDGDVLKVIVTTNAVNPSFEWYKDDVLIPGSLTNTYVVTSEGNYKVKVTQSSTCAAVNEIPFVVNTVVVSAAVAIPNLISPNNDQKNDTWDIPAEYINNKTQVVIMNSNGEVVFRTDNYNNWPNANNWPDPNNPINFDSVTPVFYYIITKQGGEVKNGSITVVK